MNERCRSRPRGAIRRRCGAALLSLALFLAAPVLPAQTALPANLVAFLEAFDYAFRHHDRDAAVALFYWRGVTDQDRARIMALIDRDLALDLHGVRLVPPGDVSQRFEVEGILMRRNLPVVARLLVRFNDTDGETRYSLHDLGLEDDAFYIVLAAPETGI